MPDCLPLQALHRQTSAASNLSVAAALVVAAVPAIDRPDVLMGIRPPALRARLLPLVVLYVAVALIAAAACAFGHLPVKRP